MTARTAGILLVEDNPGDVHLLQQALDDTGAGIRLSVVPDVNAALALLTDACELPALIVLDLNLPATHGTVALSLIKATEDWNDIPVIVLTSSRLPRERDHCRRMGAAAFWVKPSEWNGYVQCALDLARFIRTGESLDMTPAGTPAIGPTPIATEWPDPMA